MNKTKNNTMYNYVDLEMQDGSVQPFRVDYLVLASFRPIENMENEEIIHLDGDTLNDHLDNLMWKSEYDARYTLNRVGGSI